ncbi:MAG: hypothetical protein ABIT76_09365 [Chthoniobacterales bacterium]
MFTLQSPGGSDLSKLIHRIRHLTARHGAGSLEQILVAVLNFGIVIVTGRLLAPSSFAIFVVIMSSLSLAFGLVSAVVSAPVLVLYRKRYHSAKRSYLGKLELLNVGVSVAVGLVCLAIAFWVERRISSSDLVYSLLMLTAWSSYELRRKIAYALGEAPVLLLCSALVLLSAVISLGVTVFLGVASEGAVLLCLALSYLLGILFFKLLTPRSDTTSKVPFQVLLRDHWRFSHSLFSGLLLYWVASQGYFLVAARLLPDATLGGVRTAQNMAGLITTALLMFENQATPMAATLAHEGGDEAVRSWVRQLFDKGTWPFLAFVILASLGAFGLHHFLYLKTYSQFSWLAFIFAFHQFLLGLNRPYAVGLKAIEKTTPIFWGHCAGAALMVLGSWILITYLGALGVAIGFVLSASALLLVLHLNFWRLTQ